MRAALLLVVAGSSVAYAQDPFEIQVYDVETAHQGEPGLEIHINEHLIKGAPDQTHTTFEPHYGLRDWLELGGYLQSSVATGERYTFAGAKLRLKARLPKRYWDDRLGFAINGELSIVPSQFEPAVYGSEIRPIAELRMRRLFAAINPILTTDLAGDFAGHPQFEPCAKLAWLVTPALGLGVEGYAALGPLDDLGAESVEQAFGVVDINARAWSLEVGVGVNHGSADHPVGKLIFGIHP
jgi:hypothetical protein